MCSTASDGVQKVRDQIVESESVLVLIDSNQSQAHVAAELEAYGPIVSPESYIVACDGIMQQVAGAPLTDSDWSWNNPITAVQEVLQRHEEFKPMNRFGLSTKAWCESG